MSIHNVVNFPRHSHEGRGLFVLGTSKDANAAVAHAMQSASVPSPRVLKVHVQYPRTTRALVRSICQAAGVKLPPSDTFFHMTQRSLELIREMDIWILHVDGMHADIGSPSKVDTDLCCDLFRFLLARGISLVINGPHHLRMLEGPLDLIRRFRFLSARDLASSDVAYLLRRL